MPSALNLSSLCFVDACMSTHHRHGGWLIIQFSRTRICLCTPIFHSALTHHVVVSKGIAYYRNFLSPEEAARALAIVESNEWRKDIKRRQQFYGEVYYLTTHHHEGLQPDKGNEKKNVCDLSQFDWLKEKIMGDTWHSRIFGTKEKYDNGDDNDYSNFPTQILVNEYIGE